MARVLVKTGNPAWFVDAADPEGKKVRKGEEDQIFDNLLEAQEALSVLRAAHGPDAGNGNGGDPVAEKPKSNSSKAKSNGAKADKPAPTPVTLSSGKTVTGATTTIKCAWLGKDDGEGKSGKRCNKERVIKVQDAFQVKYCTDHQKRARQVKVNERNRAKTAAKKAAAAAK